jgi:FAD synthase
MKRLSQQALDSGRHVIADFVCPTPKTREDFGADYTVWIDTIKEGRFEDTNKMFVPPETYDFRVPTQNAELWAIRIADEIQDYVWDNRKPTAQMLGRWQPWHEGHQTLFEEIIKKTGQVEIMVRDVLNIGDNPFDFYTVKTNIEKALTNYKNRFKITMVSNITNICYGRGVGYKIEEIELPERIQKISATEIRKKMRSEGKL